MDTEEPVMNKNQILSKTIVELIPALTFMFAEPDDDLIIEDGKTYLKASMGFYGYINGNLEIAASRELCQEFAMGMLGNKGIEDESTDWAKDVLTEILNTVCGKFLTSFLGDEPSYNLEVPEVIEVKGDSLSRDTADKYRMSFDIEGESLFVFFI